MLPRLPADRALARQYLDFLAALRDSEYSGEQSTSYASRLLAATDNSVYQKLPQAVLYPRTTADIQVVMELLGEARFRSVSVSARGGGTGTNGQSLTDGIVLDVSRHLNRVLEINEAERWVRVQPGVVLDQLNDELRERGLFFAPNLSPSNRATLGGMINTDACGKGSRIYGRTSDHVLALDLVLWGGERFTSEAQDPTAFRSSAPSDGHVDRICRSVDDIVRSQQTLINERFLKLQRFMTGYNLPHVYRHGLDGPFNLNSLICGSEGTLAIVSEAKLRLTEIPAYKTLVVVKYTSFDDALKAANLLVQRDPGAIETIDDTILDLAKNDIIWHRVEPFLRSDGHPMQGINLVEFWSSDPAEVQRKVEQLCQTLDAERGKAHAAIGYYVTQNALESEALWDLRKKGVGLLGAAKGERRPIAFVEDTVVPPERLADYIREFRALLEDAGLSYGMFGHVDVGCLHVRPALNLRAEEDEQLMRRLSDDVMALVQKYGGVMWGEHGRGFRSEYTPQVFGPELYAQLQKIKAIFDPHNQLNPGKIATAAGTDTALVRVDALKRGALDRQITQAALQKFEVAVSCNGNGACYDVRANSVMCPSSKITRDRVHSPKGRAGMMREWLRRLSNDGFDAGALSPSQVKNSWLRWFRPAAPHRGDKDFSHEVYAAMQGCLACKACATQCPIKVDVPVFRSEFFELYHTRYRRPLRDYLIGGVERSARWMAAFPGLTNFALKRRFIQSIIKASVGMVDTPLVSSTPLSTRLAARGWKIWKDAELLSAAPETIKSSLVIVQDPVTSFYEAEIVVATCELVKAMGLEPRVLQFGENGKGLHIKGMLRKFKRVAQAQSARLRALAHAGYPLVGIDPAYTLTYRDEYRHTLTPDEFPPRVALLQEWLHQERTRLKELRVERTTKVHLLGHCTERTALAQSDRLWREIFESAGVSLQSHELGCCGMCGAFGHEAMHVDESRGIFELSWQQRLTSLADQGAAHVTATGHSCRSQTKRVMSKYLDHPVVTLAHLLASKNAVATSKLQDAKALPRVEASIQA